MNKGTFRHYSETLYRRAASRPTKRAVVPTLGGAILRPGFRPTKTPRSVLKATRRRRNRMARLSRRANR